MRHIGLAGNGGPEVIRLVEGERPQPHAGEVLIEVHAVGVNRPDVVQRQGNYPPPPGASEVLGLEVAGRIAGAGAGVTRWKSGDAVCALLSGGGYAEYALADARHCLPVPPGLSFAGAAALPETYFTVWTNVFERGRLAAGETLLVHGGSSGIGATAIQLAKARGATVYTTAGSAEKTAFCLGLGAEAAIDYRSQDFVEEIARLTGGRGADVILDMVGEAYFERNLQCLADDGRLVHIAVLQGVQARYDIRALMRRRLTLTGSTLRARSAAEKARLAAQLERHVWPLLAEGRCRPPVHRVFPLAEAAEAHRLMESSRHLGKIVLEVRQS